MKLTPKKRGRPTRESSAVVEFYRQRIASAALRSGQRLPSREQIAQRHRVSLPTAQRAMARLEAEGWIESRGRRGTFVAERLPYQTRYALVLPYHPADPDYLHAWPDSAIHQWGAALIE